VGVFDGVHRAHQSLIRSTVRLARRLKAASVVVTFDPDPHAVLSPGAAPPALMTLDARLEALNRLGVEIVWVLTFTPAFSRLAADAFVRRYLHRLAPAALLVGETFAFGRDRRGNMATLRTLARTAGVRVIAVPEIRLGRRPISSSRIRRLIAAGRLRDASRLLGRAPALYGAVVRGAGRGRRLGIPTANVRFTAGVLPPQGVYAVLLRAGGSTRRGVMNLGVRPTFGPGPLVAEVHQLQGRPVLRGRSVTVSLISRLRSERCFSSPDALVRQVRRDARRARRVFARIPHP
jgi:riboflavin kinase/FMN adenylyltransferase